MARMRTLKPDFFSDRRMTKMSAFARLLYMGIWCFALCERGHLPDDAEELVLKILPRDEVDPDALLAELIDQGRVLRRRLPDGTTYLHAWKLPEHAKVDPRWTPRCPYCAAETQQRTPTPPEPPADSRLPADEPEPPEDSVSLPETPASFSESPGNSRELRGVSETSPGMGRLGEGRLGEGVVVAAVEQPTVARGRAQGQPPPHSGPAGRVEELIAEWTAGKRRPGDLVVKASLWAHQALAEGFTRDQVLEALRRYDAKLGDKGPGLLPYILDEVANSGRAGTDVVPIGQAPSRRVAASRSTNEDRVNGWLALPGGAP